MADDGRVTLAVIKRDLEYIKADIKEIKEDLKDSHDLHSDHEKRLAKAEEKNSNSTYIMLAFTSIASALAAWLGMRR